MDSPAKFYGVTCKICSEKENSRIASKKLLACEGFCGSHFHPACLGLPGEVIDFCKNYEKFIEFKCLDCRRTTSAHVIKAFAESVEHITTAIDNQSIKTRRSLLNKLSTVVAENVNCSNCSSKTLCEASTQTETIIIADKSESVVNDNPIEPGEWRIVGNRKIWKKWNNSAKNSESKKKLKKKRKDVKSGNNNNNNGHSNFSNDDRGSGQWELGPPAAVFSPSAFCNSGPLRTPVNDRQRSLKITGLASTVTTDELYNFLLSKFRVDANIRSLTPRNLRFPATYSSFKITVPDTLFNEIMNPRIWAAGTEIREFTEDISFNKSHNLGFHHQISRINHF